MSGLERRGARAVDAALDERRRVDVSAGHVRASDIDIEELLGPEVVEREPVPEAVTALQLTEPDALSRRRVATRGA
ncbi:MAG TPA: hypothetical protein VE907_09250 [Gammaproteobacteria bacterium]|nr:hypothetical protein [Gammaproteobacteria bacterium]